MTPSAGSSPGDDTRLAFDNYDCDHFFTHQNTPDSEKLGTASFHLEGDAQLWFLRLRNYKPTLSWEEFQSQCLLRFGPTIQSNKVRDLSKLQKTGSVDEYQRRLDKLLAHTSPLKSAHKVNIFVNGLQEGIYRR